MLFKVRDRKSGVERSVTPAAYAAKGPKVYEKLGVVDESGNETAVSPNRNSSQVQRSVSGAAPVVVRQIQVPEKEEIKSEQVTQPAALQEQTEQKPEIKEKKKPGPKPKSISSNPNADEK
jgi:hypothetical protein